MRYKILKRLKPNYKNNKCHQSFDVETVIESKNGYDPDDFKHNINGSMFREQKFCLGGVMESNGKYHHFWDNKDMNMFMLSRKFYNTRHFATNLEFDFMHIFDTPDSVKDMFLLDHNGFMYARWKEPGKYKVNKDCKIKQSTHNIEFLDTYNYTGVMTLESMGEQIGIPKLPQPRCFTKYPRSYKDRQELIEYNKRDCLITLKYSEYLREFYNNLGCKMKITLASTGQDLWRRKYQPKDIFQEPRAILKKHFEGSVRGGRTELIKRGYFKKLYYYDYVSHYPACCYDGIDGKGTYPDPSTYKYNRELHKDYIDCYEGITKVDITVPDMYIQPLPYYYKNKLLFPSGSMTGWYTNIELRNAVKHGAKINKVHKGIYYRDNFVPFREAVKDLSRMKREYKRQGNLYLGHMVKVLMNSGLYGKFAQKIDKKVDMYPISKLECDDKGRGFIKINNKNIYLTDHFIRGNFIFNKSVIDVKIPVFVNPILASYTSAMGRIKLFNEMIRYPDNMIYCDTDSMVVDKKLWESGLDLGDLELENVIEEAVFVRPKQYRILNDAGKEFFKTKGVPNRYINDRKKFDKMLKDREIFIEKFTKTKESAIRHLSFSSIITICKHLDLEDNKRLWSEMFDIDMVQESLPHNIIDGVTEHDYNIEVKKAMQMYHGKMTDEMIMELQNTDFFDSMDKGQSKEDYIKDEIDFYSK